MGLLHTDFRDGTLPTKRTCHTVIILPKRAGKCREIGLIEFLWETIPGLINCRIGELVKFHNSLHGFKVGIGMSAVSLEEI